MTKAEFRSLYRSLRVLRPAWVADVPSQKSCLRHLGGDLARRAFGCAFCPAPGFVALEDGQFIPRAWLRSRLALRIHLVERELEENHG